MKKIVALLLSVMLVLGCTGAVAEMDLSNGVSVSATYELNKDMFSALLQLTAGTEMAEEIPEEMIAAVIDLLCAINVTAAVDGETLNLNLNLNETPIVTLEGSVLADGSIAAATNVLPSYVFGVDAQTMSQLQAELENAMGQIDVKKLEAAAEKLEDGVEDVMEGLAEKWLNSDKAVQETGKYMMGDVTYTHMTAIETDSNDLLLFVQDMMNGLIPLLETYFIESGLPVEEMDFDELKESFAEEITPEADPIPVYLTIYDEAQGYDDYAYITFEMADDEGALAMVFAIYDEDVEASIYFGEGNFENVDEIINAAYDGQEFAMVLDVAAVTGETDEEMNVVYSLVTGGMFMGYYVETKPVDGGVDGRMEMYFMNDETPLLSANVKVRPLTEKLAPVSVENKTLVTIDQLMDMDSELEDGIEQDATAALSSLLINAIVAAPDEIQAIMNMAVQMEFQEETMDTVEIYEDDADDWEFVPASEYNDLYEYDEEANENAADGNVDAMMNDAVNSIMQVMGK